MAAEAAVMQVCMKVQSGKWLIFKEKKKGKK